jgi:hypothetical protein
LTYRVSRSQLDVARDILFTASYFDANIKGVPRREDVGSFARVGKRF